jgi:hypothetical protein
MSIESILERIATALERAATAPVLGLPAAAPAATPAKAAKPAAKAAAAPAPAEAPAEAAATISHKEMGEAIVKLIQANKRADAVNLLQDHGAKAISEVKAADVQTVYEKANAILELA